MQLHYDAIIQKNTIDCLHLYLLEKLSYQMAIRNVRIT